MTIKEQLKGTCVLNEKEGMGAEIVALYTEVGINNRYGLEGLDIDSYYGCDRNGDIDCTDEENTIFDKVLTLSQLREIVSTPEYKEPIKWSFAKETSPELEEQIKNAKPAKINSSEGIAQPISEPQFKAGQIVDVWNKDDKSDLQPAKYRFFADGKYWCETCASDIVVNFKNIEPNSECKLREKAEELYNKWNLPPYTTTKEIIIEAIKWGQENK